MKAQELSRKYATAVFSLALDKWLTVLRSTQEKLSARPDLVKKLKDGSIPFAERQKELAKVMPADGDQYIQNFINTMLRDGDIELLGDVIDEIGRMAQGGPQVQVARVTTAMPLSEDEKEQFYQKLRKKYGEDLELDFNVDSSIVGGVIIQIGDKIIDGSIATRLGSMSNLLGVN